MPLLTPRGQTKNAVQVVLASTQMVDLDTWIEEITLANLGYPNFADNDWIGCFNVRYIGEGGTDLLPDTTGGGPTSNWGITSQSTSCFYFMHPRHVTDYVDFMLVGRAA